MFSWEMRNLLAQHVEAKNAKMAKKVLRDQAGYFKEQAQQSSACPLLYHRYDARTKHLLSASLEINNLLAVEKSIERERATIRALDKKLVEAVKTLRSLIGESATIARALHEAGLDDGQFHPIFQGRAQFTVYYYHTPLLYLESFGLHPTSALSGWQRGRPDTHETIESLGFCHWPFMPVALCDVWQRYLYDSLNYYSQRLDFARGPLGSTDALFEISDTFDELTTAPFNVSKVRSVLELVKKLFDERTSIKRTIAEEISKVDYFYDSLYPCEKSLFITELSPPFGYPERRIGDIFRPLTA
jgi:hypothetical protein